MKPLVLDDEAREEYRHALGTYAADSIAVANRFAERVDEAMERIATEPHVWPLASGVAEHLRVTKYRIDRFPYSVLFVELATEGPRVRAWKAETRLLAPSRAALAWGRNNCRRREDVSRSST